MKKASQFTEDEQLLFDAGVALQSMRRDIMNSVGRLPAKDAENVLKAVEHLDKAGMFIMLPLLGEDDKREGHDD